MTAPDATQAGGLTVGTQYKIHNHDSVNVSVQEDQKHSHFFCGKMYIFNRR